MCLASSSACSGAEERPYFNRLRDCMVQAGIQADVSSRAQVRSAVARCERKLGGIPTPAAIAGEFNLDPKEFSRASEVFLVVLERCLQDRGYPVRIERGEAIVEIVSTNEEVPLEDLKLCATSATRAERAFR